jgi:hypothetical protein
MLWSTCEVSYLNKIVATHFISRECVKLVKNAIVKLVDVHVRSFYSLCGVKQNMHGNDVCIFHDF